MIIKEIKLNSKGKPISSQRVVYKCDYCGREMETFYYCYLRKKTKIDYCPSCKQMGSRGPNYGKSGTKNYFFGKKHSQETKNLISSSKIGRVSIKEFPSNENPHLRGKLKFRVTSGKPVTNQRIIRICSGCSKEEIINFTTCVNYSKCKSCVNIESESIKKGAHKWIQENKEEFKKIIQKSNRNIERRKRLSMSLRKVSEWDGFAYEKSSHRKDYHENKEKYDQWRKLVFQRDNYTCMFPNCAYCGNKRGGIYLEAHHIKTRMKFPKLKFSLDNGITLCANVHRKKLNKHEEEFETLLLKVIYSNVN